MPRLLICLLVLFVLCAACDSTPTGLGYGSRCDPRVYETPSGPITIPRDSVCH